MNDFTSLGKNIVRELSCRLCLNNDVTKLKPLSAESKRKLKRLFDIVVQNDDNLPKAICHDCLQQISVMHLYAVKVDKTQKFLHFHKMKQQEEQLRSLGTPPKLRPLVAVSDTGRSENQSESIKTGTTASKTAPISPNSESLEHQVETKKKSKNTKKKPLDVKYLEAMPLDEFAKTENVEKSLLDRPHSQPQPSLEKEKKESARKERKESVRHTDDVTTDILDPLVIIDGRPAKQGAALDRQITLFYKMECCICHENGFHFRSLMKHYKDRHGVPGYVTCCNKKFHYFYPKKIIEHMAFHLQANIFMCSSCHQNFPTSADLLEHQSNGGKSEGKVVCPRCAERFPTYHELGWHLVIHRSDKPQCDFCGKLMKHCRRKKTINKMEDMILCSLCTRTLKTIEKQEKELRNLQRQKSKHKDHEVLLRHQKFRQAMGLSGDEDGSTD